MQKTEIKGLPYFKSFIKHQLEFGEFKNKHYSNRKIFFTKSAKGKDLGEKEALKLGFSSIAEAKNDCITCFLFVHNSIDSILEEKDFSIDLFSESEYVLTRLQEELDKMYKEGDRFL